MIKQVPLRKATATAPNPTRIRLDTPIQFIKGVGPKLAEVLNKKGMKYAQDLLQYYPRTYEDQRAVRQISNLKPGDVVALKAKIIKVAAIPMGRTQRKMYDIHIKDAAGGSIHCKYFRVPYRGYFERFQPQQTVRVIGKVIDYRGRLEFHHPDIKEVMEEPLDEKSGEAPVPASESDNLLPIYTEVDPISSDKFARIIRQTLETMDSDQWIEKFPAEVIQKYDLITNQEALYKVHQPEVEKANEYLAQTSKAHYRLIFEEFFWLELFLAARKKGVQKEKTIPLVFKSELAGTIERSLPFELTKGQKTTLAEIEQDLKKEHPMLRLLQGDVGCGKTLVAFLSVAFVKEAQRVAATKNALLKPQAALMVPTEILAEQHYKNAVKTLTPFGIEVGLLTGSSKNKDRVALLEKLKNGEIDLLIGTHALIEDEVIFQNLSLVIIDEQHRFGVEQRGRLKVKGVNPHFLIMTATPIPRTLAMTVYGDLEVSQIREMPPGRSPIQTRVIFESKRPQALEFMKAQIVKGRQAYVIYPLVSESEKIDLKNAVDEFEKLKSAFPEFKVDILHGQMKPAEKEEVMKTFRSGQTQILVSTTVIEVGVDVPNANLIMIEHSERFGLSQLHQLRGRVGRGEHKSFCVMICGYAVSQEGQERVKFMETTNDGFKVAEYDLELRGPGEFLGTRQSGLPGFRIANIIRDVEILQKAREAAFNIFENDPNLSDTQNLFLKEELLRTHGPSFLMTIA